MRRLGRKRRPPNTLAAPNQANQSSGWPLVSQVMKAMVASGVLLFVCNLGYDGAKATIFRGWQLEEENKQLKTRLEMIEHKILPKVEQAQKDVKDIQAPLDLHEKLTPAQMDKLAFKARGIHAALEEIGYFVKLNTHAANDFPQENYYAGLVGSPSLNLMGRLSDTASRQNSARFAILLPTLPSAVPAHANSLEDSLNPVASITVVDFEREESSSETAFAGATTNSLAAFESDQFANWVAPLAGIKKPAVARNLEFEGLLSLPAYRHPDDVRAVVARHKAALQDCYKQALKIAPNLEGEIKVRFTVSTAGHVIAASLLSSTTNNARLEQLILEKIRRWGDFGEVNSNVGNQTFRQTFVFVDAAQTDEPALTTKNFTSSSLTR
ncbi:TonB family protein [candidate division KSB1 bacterium]|nr:TonB family protein [candidate division KSB1 bacterium]